MILKDEWVVRSIEHADAVRFIETFHYAKGASKTSVFRFGLFPKAHGDVLMGTTLWLPPTRVAAESVDKANWRRVLSLSRMAVFPMLGRNACSFMLARAVKAIERDGRWVALVTYADESQGHEGLVYRASGWTYVGRTAPSVRWIDPRTGRQVATQATKTRTAKQMEEMGFVNTGAYCKHKYVRRLRSPA